MDGFLEGIHAVLGQGEAVTIASAAAAAHADVAAGQPDDRAIARQLAATLDRAMERGQWAFAERIAAQSHRIAQHQPLLAERLARLRATQADFETALAIIDACREQPASMRLLRTVRLLQLGRREEAHSDLHMWARKAAAPLPARLILAMLEWGAGDEDAAFAALQHNLRQIEDPHSLAALMLMSAARGRQHLADRWAGRLRCATAMHPQAALYRMLLLASGQDADASTGNSAALPSAAATATLAGDLLADESVIPALAEAACLVGDQAKARLLIDALHHALDDLDDQASACAALAQLHELLDERDVAEAWRGRAQEHGPRDDVLASIGRDGVSLPQPLLWERAA